MFYDVDNDGVILALLVIFIFFSCMLFLFQQCRYSVECLLECQPLLVYRCVCAVKIDHKEIFIMNRYCLWLSFLGCIFSSHEYLIVPMSLSQDIIMISWIDCL